MPAFSSAWPPAHFLRSSSQDMAWRCRTHKRTRPRYVPSMHLFEPIHTLPEFLNQVVVSCGIGLVGIAGAKATEHARALTAGDRKADEMDALAREIDSFRRRRELADVKEDRDWNDVSVDRYGSIVVTPEVVPELESHDDLEAFDRLLMDSPAARRLRTTSEEGGLRRSGRSDSLPEPTDFRAVEDDAEDEG